MSWYPFRQITRHLLLRLVCFTRSQHKLSPREICPQLQLLSRYIGNYSVSYDLYGSILRTYISAQGVVWTEGVIAVFDGMESVLDHCKNWLEERIAKGEIARILRDDAQHAAIVAPSSSLPEANIPRLLLKSTEAGLPSNFMIFEAEPISDRKSSFVGRACAITNPGQVLRVVSPQNLPSHVVV